MLHKFYAQRELNIDQKPIAIGELIATIDSDHDVNKVIHGLSAGMITANPVEPAAKPAPPPPPPAVPLDRIP